MTYSGHDSEPPIVPYDDDEDERNLGEEFIDVAVAIGLDSLTAFTAALMSVGAGVLFFIAFISERNGIEDPLIHYGNLLWWLVLGAGVAILFVEIFIRAAIPRFRSQIGERLIIVIILLTVGIGGKIGWGLAIAVLLIGLGPALLIIVFGAKRG